MIYKSLLFYSLCAIGYICAGDYVRPTYKDKVLTPENLISSLHEECPLTAESKEKLNQWVILNKNLLSLLIHGFLPNSEWKTELLLKNEMTKENGYSNESNWNHVFRIPIVDENGKYYRVFIAGKINKINNKLAEKGLYGKPFTREQLDTLTVENTYQSISRGLGYLLFIQSKEGNNAASVDTPKTYAIQLPESDESKPVDETTIIVQEEIDDAQSVNSCSEISEKELTDLYYVTRDALLWNIKAQDLLRKDNKLYVLDLEQPNNTPKFMERSRDAQERLSVISIQELIKFCAKCPDHLKRLQVLIEKDSKVQQYHTPCHQDALNSVSKYLSTESSQLTKNS